MHFRKAKKTVTPTPTAIPPDTTRAKEGPNTTHGGTPAVFARKGMPEHVMWATERPDGGRGFGISGAHYHKNWADDNFRKVVLNAILWIAKAEGPSYGVKCEISADDLALNLDPQNK